MAVTNEKKYIMKTKKKNIGAETGWATTQLYYKRKGFCIEIQSMYCKLEGLDRLSYCIATRLGVLQWEQQVGWKGVAIHCEVYCDLKARHCIVEAVEVCCNTNIVL